MKIPVVTDITTNTKNFNQISKQLKSADVKSIKNYTQYMRVYGLKK